MKNILLVMLTNSINIISSMDLKKIIVLSFLLSIGNSVFAQFDKIQLLNGKNLKGDYKLLISKQGAMDLYTNTKEVIKAKDIYAAYIDGEKYRKVDIEVKGDQYSFLIKKIQTGKISIYKMDVPFGTLRNYDVDLIVYYFEKNEELTAIPKNNIKDFYQNYFGDCFMDRGDNFKHQYTLQDIKSVLNDFTNCSKLGYRPEYNRFRKTKLGINLYGGVGSYSRTANDPNSFSLIKKKGAYSYGVGGKLGFSNNVMIAINYDYRFMPGEIKSEVEGIQNFDLESLTGSLAIMYNKSREKFSFRGGIGIMIGKLLPPSGFIEIDKRNPFRPTDLFKLSIDESIADAYFTLELEYLLSPYFGVFLKSDFTSINSRTELEFSRDFDIKIREIKLGAVYYFFNEN